MVLLKMSILNANLVLKVVKSVNNSLGIVKVAKLEIKHVMFADIMKKYLLVVNMV